MIVINIDRDGKEIPDLSRVVVPLEQSSQVVEILNPGVRVKEVERHEQVAN
ncbi:hypothetical protein [Bhargavaea ginsengi]|uniref:hypothetical protein n=1 Tax=Bhargavaea ginsengi TaxID=426757 RepID=UPI003C77F081